MGDARSQWALAAFASAVTLGSSNNTTDKIDGTDDGSGTDWHTVVKGSLPIFTLFIGFVGQYWVKTSYVCLFGTLN
jgi:hypothetical protein